MQRSIWRRVMHSTLLTISKGHEAKYGTANGVKWRNIMFFQNQTGGEHRALKERLHRRLGATNADKWRLHRWRSLTIQRSQVTTQKPSSFHIEAYVAFFLFLWAGCLLLVVASRPSSQNFATTLFMRGPSSTPNQYDALLDDGPLSLEEEAAILQMESALPPKNTSSGGASSGSPTPKKRRRDRSASPLITPSRLRGSVKPSARALDAGYRPSTGHRFRQGPTTNPPSIAGEVKDPEPVQQAAAQSGDGSFAGQSESKGPVQLNVHRAGEPSGRRSESMDPPHRVYASGTGAQAGYYAYGQPPTMQQYNMYTNMAHPHGMPQHLQHTSVAFGNPQTPQYYPNAMLRDPNAPADVFSPYYIPQEPRQSRQASVSSTLTTDAGQGRQSRQGSVASAVAIDAPQRADSYRPPEPPAAPTVSAVDAPPRLGESGALAQESIPGAPPRLDDSNSPLQDSTLGAPPRLGGAGVPLLAAKSEPQSDAPHLEEPVESEVNLNESPTVGRLSNKARDALTRGFQKLDSCVKQISAETKLTPVQIVERWDATGSRTVNSWNIYQGYFAENREQEVARLSPEDQPPPAAVASTSTISACYKKFCSAKPNTFDSILRAWHRLDQMEESSAELTIGRRSKEFKRHVQQLETLIRKASSMYGFETFCITLGAVVNQDQNLAEIVGSESTTDFFLERFRTPDIVALGHMKAHVYDRLSKQAMLEDSGSTAPIPGASAAAVKSETTPGPVGELTSVPGANELKERLIQIAKPHNINITKGTLLIWKGLARVVANAGCVFVNWPEDVPFPADEKSKNGSKGISALKQPARALLLASFDHPTHPLMLEKKFGSTAVPKSHPVIIGAPPESSSPHAFGRRKFLDENCNEDRKGPPRLKSATVSGSRKQRIQPSTKPHTQSRKEGAVSEPQEIEASDASNGGGVANSSPISLNDSSDDDAPLLKGLKKGAATKPKPRVAFVAETSHDDDDEDNASYIISRDGSPKYSGSDNDPPPQRSPHMLRQQAKPTAKGKKPESPKKPLRKRQRRIAEEDGVASSEEIEEAAVAAKRKESPKKSFRKRRRQIAEEGGGTGLEEDEDIVVARIKAPDPGVAKPARRNASEDERTDSIAEKLFSNANRVEASSLKSLGPPPSNMSDARKVSPLPAHVQRPNPDDFNRPQAPPMHTQGSLPPPTHPQSTNGPPPAPHAHFARQDGYFAPNYRMYAPEPYGGQYDAPPGWGMPPAQGWYPPGPITSGPPGPLPSGPAAHTGYHHGGYWSHQGPAAYSNTYGQHPPAPGMPPEHLAEDEALRGRGSGSAS
ncbi:hypothetical protein BDN70DRAFT_895302 [Pholiota conissans]|uniref:Uncharacterized protein n=1 Tax=Pholiota conissans TaxID=109636 RepID=A0A9P5Z2M9_9AGAR|nr:hypothetical protein BDN70DRAFT_895302 [Pholiota conissans]